MENVNCLITNGLRGVHLTEARYPTIYPFIQFFTLCDDEKRFIRVTWNRYRVYGDKNSLPLPNSIKPQALI